MKGHATNDVEREEKEYIKNDAENRRQLECESEWWEQRVKEEETEIKGDR